MNADALLAHYARIADAPDAIARLRRFVLDLAVRGKLVEQDAADEPASELLKRIAAEKAKFGSIYVEVPLSREEMPFDLPDGWGWSRIGGICTKTGSGSTPRGGQSVYKVDGIPFLRSQNVYDDGLRLDDVAYIDLETHSRMSGTAVRPADLLLNITGGSMGRCCRIPDAFECANVSQHVAIMRGALPEMADFLHSLVLSPYFQAFIFDEQTGAGRGGLPKNKMDRIAVALPPLAEQQRIVAKVGELMALCDRLEAARTEREAARDRLAAASLARLNAPDPDPATFTTHARFTLNNLAPLTTRPDQIKHLRQTILNLAVRGKLVEQSQHDLPAREVSLTIVEKRRGQMRESIEDPFALPKGWAWRAIDTLANQVTDGEHSTPPRISEKQVPLVTAKNVRDGFMDYSNTDWVSKTTAEKAWGRCKPIVGDLLLVCVGATTGRLTVLREEADMVLVRSVALIRPNHEICSEYLERAIRSPALQEQIWASVKVAAQPCLYINRIQSLVVPLPPLAEQHRIVAKVDELMALCDRLEASLATTDQTRRRLLEALLHEALEPATARALEPA